MFTQWWSNLSVGRRVLVVVLALAAFAFHDCRVRRAQERADHAEAALDSAHRASVASTVEMHRVMGVLQQRTDSLSKANVALDQRMHAFKSDTAAERAAEEYMLEMHSKLEAMSPTGPDSLDDVPPDCQALVDSILDEAQRDRMRAVGVIGGLQTRLDSAKSLLAADSVQRAGQQAALRYAVDSTAHAAQAAIDAANHERDELKKQLDAAQPHGLKLLWARTVTTVEYGLPAAAVGLLVGLVVAKY